MRGLDQVTEAASNDVSPKPPRTPGSAGTAQAASVQESNSQKGKEDKRLGQAVLSLPGGSQVQVRTVYCPQLKPIEDHLLDNDGEVSSGGPLIDNACR